MIATKSVRVLAGLLCLLLGPAHAVAQLTQPARAWERHMRTGAAAYQQGNYAEAVKQTKAALSAAETFGPDDPRLAGPSIIWANSTAPRAATPRPKGIAFAREGKLYVAEQGRNRILFFEHL